jgi:hypothetical protein
MRVVPGRILENRVEFRRAAHRDGGRDPKWVLGGRGIRVSEISIGTIRWHGTG